MASKQVLHQQLVAEMAPAHQVLEGRVKSLRAMQDLAAQLIDRLDLPATATVDVAEQFPYRSDSYWRVCLELGKDSAGIDIDEPDYVNYSDSTGRHICGRFSATLIDDIVKAFNEGVMTRN